jgi:hypothetical protein
MHNQALLDTFTELLDRYEQHQGYIQRAKDQANKFSPKIVEKVVRDHSGKATAIATEVNPHLKELRDAIATIDRDRKKVTDDRNAQQTAIEELELRRTIGELEDDEFQGEADDIQKKLDEIQAQLDELTEEYQALTDARDRWKGVYREPDGESAKSSRDSLGSSGSRESVSREISPAPIDDDALEDEPMNDISIGPAMSTDDEDDDGGVDLDSGDAEDDEGPGVRVDWDDEPDQLNDIADDLIEGAPIEVTRSKTETPMNGAKAAAVLLYQEGTPEEQTYPIDGDVLTIGRSRTNHVQVKNDSKVSRVHAKVYKRDGAFYIEDNKSSNGTLVNGELITERRLFGGEELIIGETFFRFQMA